MGAGKLLVKPAPCSTRLLLSGRTEGKRSAKLGYLDNTWPSDAVVSHLAEVETG